jgi:hypothetical protein
MAQAFPTCEPIFCLQFMELLVPANNTGAFNSTNSGTSMASTQARLQRLRQIADYLQPCVRGGKSSP